MAKLSLRRDQLPGICNANLFLSLMQKEDKWGGKINSHKSSLPAAVSSYLLLLFIYIYIFKSLNDLLAMHQANPYKGMFYCSCYSF